MRVLLIPLKDPANAKTRLASLLSPDERRRLAWAMFEDVSRAAAGAARADGVCLVSSYAPAIAHARRLGWEALVEHAQASESASIDWASRVLAGRGVAAVLRLPADLPLVRAEDVDALLATEVSTPAAILVPSREGTGTNAILRTPPTLFPSRFGPNSLALHRAEAARVGVECLIVSSERIALDIDEPADLRALIELGRDTEAYAALEDMRAIERLHASQW
ncbi:MAG TPA: 2-phospho-L-lactate guanylyltransferase [Blastocatellia bacterium]|nr:2-phospho-L-lactate guanylyltransferase [Blastocatellia bacterium]